MENNKMVNKDENKFTKLHRETTFEVLNSSGIAICGYSALQNIIFNIIKSLYEVAVDPSNRF